jgi:hypothetical protein
VTTIIHNSIGYTWAWVGVCDILNYSINSFVNWVVQYRPLGLGWLGVE